MHTCSCNDDNNILTHEVAADHLVAIVPCLITNQWKKNLDHKTYLCENKGSVPPYSNILSCVAIYNIYQYLRWIWVSGFLHDVFLNFLFTTVSMLHCSLELYQSKLFSRWQSKASILTISLFVLTNLLNLTVFQALLHASVAMERKLVVDWVPSCDLEDPSAREVSLLWEPNHFYPLPCFCWCFRDACFV